MLVNIIHLPCAHGIVTSVPERGSIAWRNTSATSVAWIQPGVVLSADVGARCRKAGAGQGKIKLIIWMMRNRLGECMIYRIATAPLQSEVELEDDHELQGEPETESEAELEDDHELQANPHTNKPSTQCIDCFPSDEESDWSEDEHH